MPSETATDLFKPVPSKDHLKHYFISYTSNSTNLPDWTHDKWIEFGIEDTNIETYLAYSQHSHQDHVRENEKERVQFDSSENNKATITSIPKIPSLPICTNKDAVALLKLTEALE